MVYAKNSYKQAMIDNGRDQPEAQFGCPIANSYTQALWNTEKVLNLVNSNKPSKFGVVVGVVERLHEPRSRYLAG